MIDITKMQKIRKITLSENNKKFLHNTAEVSHKQSNKFFNDDTLDYNGELLSESMGINLKFDAKKLQDEKRIIAIITDKGLEHLKRK